jgi:hypothetical protein
MRQTKATLQLCWGRALIWACVHTYYTRIRIMLWLCFLSELYACFVLIPHRVQVHKEKRHIHLYMYCEAARSSKQLTKFCDVSPTEASELLRTHIVRFPLTMLLKALLNKFSSSHSAFERFHVKTSHVNINCILYSQKLREENVILSQLITHKH